MSVKSSTAEDDHTPLPVRPPVVLRLCPASIATPWDYVSLLKPRVMTLVIFTAACAMVMAPSSLNLYLKCMALLAIAMGSGAAGCLNMWWERHTDALMTRTAQRALPQGRMTPANALALGVILSVISLTLLELATNIGATLWLAFNIFFYVVIYTAILKPRTAQNIVIGGAAGALPPVIAWQAVDPGWHVMPWLMFALIFLWTPAHFWSLGLVMAKDYQQAGIPILPSVRGEKSTRQHILGYTILTMCVSLAPLYLGLLGRVYATVALVAGCWFVYLAWRLHMRAYAPMRFFKFSILYLFTLMLSMMVDSLLPPL